MQTRRKSQRMAKGWTPRIPKVVGQATKSQQDLNLLYNYGITLLQKEEMIARQGGVCLICHKAPDKDRNWHVDHDHTTGRIRNILCNLCNIGLGAFQDKVERLETAIAYLKKWEKL